MNDNNYCVILAGGAGTKLWPSSTHRKPKQFIDFFGFGKTLLQTTFQRISKFVSPQNIIVSTNQQYRQIVEEQLPQLDEKNLLLEPMRRNTLPSATWATVEIMHRCQDARILVVPSDQMILDEDKFAEDITAAFDYVSRSGRLLSLGVTPNRPDTNYGYIQMDDMVEENIFRVKSFTEKPELEFARLFVDDKGFLWNTGLFVWTAQDFLRYAHQNQQDFLALGQTADLISHGMEREQVVRQAFSVCPNLTIEQVCLEKMEHTDVMLCHFEWSDLGTWQALYDTMPKDDGENAVMGGKTLLYGSKRCLVKSSPDKVVVVQDLDDFLVIDDNNALLICRKDNKDAIRRFVNDIQINFGDEFL